ncbi:MAG: PD-(D/E)XK nuclease family protein [Anaerolineae bacterium]
MSEITEIEATDFVRSFGRASFPARFERLKKGYRDAQRQSRKYAPGFNIFRVLKVDRQEYKTHSAFLAELPDPTGSHEQEFLFLKAFLKHCQGKYSEPLSISGSKRPSQPFPRLEEAIEAFDWEVKTEVTAPGYGRLDIIIRCEPLSFLCVIENKVGAQESEKQLQKYWGWMQTQQGKHSKQVLIFLTPGGVGSQTAGSAPYFKLSYSDDILPWLEDALTRVEAPFVTTAIRQYMQLISGWGKKGEK